MTAKLGSNIIYTKTLSMAQNISFKQNANDTIITKIDI